MCFLYRIEKRKMSKTEDTWLWCNHKEADRKILFYVWHLVAPDNVVVKHSFANVEKFSAGINVWLETELHTSNTLRHVNVNKLDQSLGNSLCVALPGFCAFTGSNYTPWFNCEDKIRPLELLYQMKKPLLSKKEVQTTFKTIEKLICVMYDRKNLASIVKVQLDIFLKKYKPNKNDNVLKGIFRRIDGGRLTPCFRALQKKIFRTTFISFLENCGRD